MAVATMLVFPPFRLDVSEERLWRGATLLTLRRKPFAVLRYLASHPRQLVTQEELLREVWGGNVVSESAVRTHLHELRQVLGAGVIETVIGRGYRFIAEVVEEVPSPLQVEGPRRTTDRMVVGRTAALDVLRAGLDRTMAGHRQLCFVTGEPGIGKTTLIDAWFDELEERADVIEVRGHCLEQHGTPEPYLAVIELLTQLRASTQGDRVLAALVRNAPTMLAQLPHLVPDAQLEEVTRRAGGGTEARMVRELMEAFEAMSAHQTIVIVLEDLQWADVATLDLLAMLGARRERAQLMIVGTARRAEAQTVAHPLNRVMRGLITRGGATALPLERIDASDLRQLLALRFGDHALPDSLIDVIDRITRGTPLFVASILEDLVTRGMIAQREGRWTLTVSLEQVAAHRPDSVKNLIDIQLDRLSLDEQRVLEAASVIGPEFATGLVAAAVERSVEEVDELCDDLARRALFLRPEQSEDWPDGTVQTRYAVTHALVQEVCRDRTVPARRQRWHRSIAQRLETAYATRTDEISHVLAMHYDHGQVPTNAVVHYLAAAQRAARRFATTGALALYRRASELIPRLPAGAERDRLELRALQGMSSSVLRNAQQSSREPLALFEEMTAIAQRLDDKPTLCGALVNLAVRMCTLAEYARARELCEQAEQLMQGFTPTPDLQLFYVAVRALCMYWQGELSAARPLLESVASEEGVPNDGVQFGILGPTDRVTTMTVYLSILAWLMGEPDRAFQLAERADEMARRSGDPYIRGLTSCSRGRLLILGNAPPDQVRQAAEIVLGLPGAEVWHVQAQVLIAWAESRTAPLGEAALDALVNAYVERVTAFPMGRSLNVFALINVLRVSGQETRSLEMLDEMIAFTRSHGERLFTSELVRMRGEALEIKDPDAAIAAYREAHAIAHAQGAVMTQLRSANRLTVLQLTDEHRALVAQALANIVGGEQASDVVEARRLLVPAS